MKKYYAYVAKAMVGYFERKLTKLGVIIITRELIKGDDNELYYYYVLEAKDEIMNPEFEIKGA